MNDGTVRVVIYGAVAAGTLYLLYQAGKKVSAAIESATNAAPHLVNDIADKTQYAFGEVVNFGGAAADSYGQVIHQVSPAYYNWAAKQTFLYPIFDFFTGNKLAGSN